MARRKNKSNIDFFIDTIREACSCVPVWAVPIVAVIGIIPVILFLLLINGLSHQLTGRHLLPGILVAAMTLFIFLTILLSGFGIHLRRWGSDQKFRNTVRIRDVSHLSWEEFEYFISAALAHLGFDIVQRSGRTPDGGIDLEARKSDNQRILIQVKHWKTRKVGVSIVREMLGLVTAHRASAGAVVTSGEFTQEAKTFARQNSIELIGHSELQRIMGILDPSTPVPAAPPPATTPSPPATGTVPDCPNCASPMIQRVARRGKNSGSTFWGCSNYPRCRGTRSA